MDKHDKVESQHVELTKAHEKLQEEKNSIAEQLQAEIELCQEAEEARNRLSQRKEELETLILDFEAKAQEEEVKMEKMAEDKKKLQTGIQELEERFEFIFFCRISWKLCVIVILILIYQNYFTFV